MTNSLASQRHLSGHLATVLFHKGKRTKVEIVENQEQDPAENLEGHAQIWVVPWAKYKPNPTPCPWGRLSPWRQNVTGVHEDVAKSEPRRTAGGSLKCRRVGQFLQSETQNYHIIQQFYLPGCTPEELKAGSHPDATPPFLPAGFPVARRWKQTRCLPIDTWTHTPNAVYTHNGVLLLGLQKQGHSDACYNMDEAWGRSAQWTKPVTKGQISYGSVCMRYIA